MRYTIGMTECWKWPCSKADR